MRFRLLKPLHGWRGFAGEVGVIVLGVLIALIFEQMAQSWDWKQNAAAAIEDMQSEYGDDDGPQAYTRVSIHDCLDARYIKLRDAVVARDGPATRAALATIRFPGRSYDNQAFEGAIAAGVIPYVEFARWGKMRAFYSTVPGLNTRAQSERMLLAELRAIYPDADNLDANARFSTLRAIEQLRELNNGIESSAYFMMQRARDAGFSIERASLNTERQNYVSNWGRCMVDPATLKPNEARIYGG
ncbi:MAG: hypothetical protein ABIO80_00525 [Sphingomicrobium sp.]